MFRSLAAALLLLTLAGSGRAADPVRLDTKSLGEMITDLGYEPKLSQDTFHSFTAKFKENTTHLWLSVSPDMKRVRFFAQFDLRPGFERAPAEAWRKILEANHDIAPSSFGLEEKRTRLTLHGSVANADITPAILRKEINAFVAQVWQNEPVWRDTNFLPALSAEGQKVLDKLQGKWQATGLTQAGNKGTDEVAATFVFTFEKNLCVMFRGGKAVLRLGVRAEGADPVEVDFFPASNKPELGILKFDGETVTICLGAAGNPRATKFESTATGKESLFVLKRVKP